ncbi:uncharacterized protein LOC126818335 [Patella vulgata]|uniref:uncharacterized protein LOC126818335 n=1 Tax=Patella vulgata TaxID=6465 RepID=UPI002180768D|nr:uncharacterized protein LOC126818335 [Patella vulgata]XP_050401645.1 uncharacterized protein LOC126818335 [Patella vulgata]XP_050401646.1 uncharacterized protein LOC126818335 [Patella vulgata]
MAFQRGPHVRDIFVGKDKIESGHLHYDTKESQSNFMVKTKNKNKQQNANNKPTKLGQYKPRILSDSDEINVPVPKHSPVRTGNQILDKPRPYIVGDKNTPIVLHPIGADDDISDNGDVNSNQETNPLQTSNPMFDKVTELGKIQTETEIIDGIVIPPPDYEEEVATMNFYEEIREKVDFTKPVHRNYGGEDFSKFLDDDDDEILEHGGLTWHSQRPPARNPLPSFDKKAKTEVKRKYQKRESKKTNKHFNTQKRNSLRNFSFADSKFADKGADRPSSGKKDKNNKEEMEFSVYGDADNFMNSNNKSYETFLHARHGDLPDLYHDNRQTDEDKEMHSPKQKDGNFWKKLTLRFKRQSSYDMSTVD